MDKDPRRTFGHAGMADLLKLIGCRDFEEAIQRIRAILHCRRRLDQFSLNPDWVPNA
jgi:hypothetical protein